MRARGACAWGAGAGGEGRRGRAQAAWQAAGAGGRRCRRGSATVHLQTSFKSIITALCGSPRRVSFMNGPGNTLGGVMYTTLFLMVTRNR